MSDIPAKDVDISSPSSSKTPALPEPETINSAPEPEAPMVFRQNDPVDDTNDDDVNLRGGRSSSEQGCCAKMCEPIISCCIYKEG